MSTGALILTAGFALLVILGFPFAIAIAAASALFFCITVYMRKVRIHAGATFLTT